jgi:ABC-type branched-subunit amino acid transport system permease subunit
MQRLPQGCDAERYGLQGLIIIIIMQWLPQGLQPGKQTATAGQSMPCVATSLG